MIGVITRERPPGIKGARASSNAQVVLIVMIEGFLQLAAFTFFREKLAID